MLEVARKLTKLLESEPDPREGAGGRREFNQTKLLMRCPPTVGVVTDNRDPDCLGRIRISYDTVVPGSVSPWLPVIGQGRGTGKGMWTLPEIGTQCLAVFTTADRSRGYVLGFIYDREHRPPKSGTEKRCDSTLLQTRSHRIEVTDKEGSEEIRIESAEGRMRVSIGKSGGIKVENELGGINIKCRNFKCEGEGEIHLATKKTFALTTADTLKISPKGNVNITSDKEVNLKGKNIKMSGTKGVTAEGRQIAVQNDKVMGFDTHIMVVPSGSGTTTVPLPHPFIGKISDKVSEDVKIGNKGAAVKGSKAKHDDSMHMQLPGTIKFQNNPKKEGEVTGGTVSKVKVDGKEVAVIGSQVTTCNDMGMQNNSVIMAAGMSIPMPAIVNPLNTEEWKREQEKKDKKEPKFTGVKWAKTSCREGEEIELSAGVKDIADGNMVTLQVFRDGQTPEDSAAIAKFPLTVKGGSVSAKWLYRADQSVMPPEQNPKFIFTAHCAWCNFEKSSNTLEVELRRPEITNLEIKDSDGNPAEKLCAKECYSINLDCEDLDGKAVEISFFNMATGACFLEQSLDIADGKGKVEFEMPFMEIEENGCDGTISCNAKAQRCRTMEKRLTYPAPEFSELRWLDEDNNETDTIEYGSKARFEARAKNLPDGEKVFAYVYRNSSENKDSYDQKILCEVKDGKLTGEAEIKESKEYLESLGEDDEVKYIFVLVPQKYPKISNEESKVLAVNFVFIINIYDDPNAVNQNDSYILEDIDGGKKYRQEKKAKDDMIADDDKITLKFEELKPGLKYRIRYVLENGKKGHIEYDNISFMDLLGE